MGWSEKEISKKCLGATKVPDSWRRRHQLLGIIGGNGAARKARGRQDYRTAGRRTGRMTPVNQAAWQPLGRLPQLAHRVRRRGKARINTTLLKMLNGLIKPDRGTITTQSSGQIKVKGRIASLLEVGTGFHPELTGRAGLQTTRRLDAEYHGG
jgi:hypothetical protein